MTPARLGAYVSAIGLLGLGVHQLSVGDLTGAATAFASAFGVVTGAHSGPAAPAN